jgi:hypothetical protein
MTDVALGFIESTPLLAGALTFVIAGLIAGKFQKDH